MIVIGKVSLNPAAFKDYTKEQFFAEYTGKLDTDKEVVWNLIKQELDGLIPIFNRNSSKGNYSPNLDKHEGIGSTSKQSKKHHSK